MAAADLDAKGDQTAELSGASASCRKMLRATRATGTAPNERKGGPSGTRPRASASGGGRGRTVRLPAGVLRGRRAAAGCGGLVGAYRRGVDGGFRWLGRLGSWAKVGPLRLGFVYIRIYRYIKSVFYISRAGSRLVHCGLPGPRFACAHGIPPIVCTRA
jgi:hypothetical protein